MARPTKPELTAAISTKEKFSAIDKEPFDAFYLGDPFCSNLAGNLICETEELGQVIREIHSLGKKAYLTTFGVPVGDELDLVKNAIDEADKAGIDAAEIGDMGVLRWVKSSYPSIDIHIGHYANVYNKNTAEFFIDYGAGRILPSNELTAKECEDFLDLPVELSVVAHGVLPLGYANTCLLLLEFPSREPKECVQQCQAGVHYLKFDNCTMRSAGHALVNGDDFSLIDTLPDFMNYDVLRLETILDDPEKISKLGKIYREAIDSIERAESPYDSEGFLDKVKKVSGGKLCNGWKTGVSGKDFAAWG